MAWSGCGDDGGPGGTGDAGDVGGSPGCEPSTCPGCCFNGVCQAGNTTVACGKGGAACGSCMSWQACPSNECRLNPASMWDLVAVSAKFETTRKDGYPWDPFGGAPDPYARFSMPDGTERLRTSVVSDSFTATWNQKLATVPASVLMSADWSIAVYDLDQPLSSDDYGGAFGTLPESAFAAGGYTDLDTGQNVKLTFKLTPR